MAKKSKVKIRLLACVLLIAVIVSIIPLKNMFSTQTQTNADYYLNLVNGGDLKLWYTKPADANKKEDGDNAEHIAWERYSLPIGNSSIGASVFGRVDKERIQLNEKSLWSGGPTGTDGARPYISNDDPYDFNRFNDSVYNGGNLIEKGQWGKTLKNIQNSFIQGDADASSKCDNLTGTWDGYGGYLSYGNMYIDFGKHKYSNYFRSLDLETAVAGVEYDIGDVHYKRENFVSHPDNVLVTRLESTGGNMEDFTVSVVSDTNGSDRTQNTTVENGTIYLSGSVSDNNMQFHSTTRIVIEGDGEIKDKSSSVKVSGASKVTIYTTIATDYKDKYPSYRTGETAEELKSRVNQYVDNAVSKGYDKVKNDHIEDYSGIYSRVKLDLGQYSEIPTDELLNKCSNNQATDSERRMMEVMLFQYGRYLTIQSSREPRDNEDVTLPSNLQGIWNDSNTAPWSSDYHMNVNLQMNYWPTYSTNMAECALPLIDYVDKLREPGRVTSAIYTGIKSTQNNPENGFMLHTQNTPFGWTCPGWSFDWGYSPASAAWILQNVWEHYEYTGNLEFMKKTIYPMLKEEAKFYSQYLCKIEDASATDGYYYMSAPAFSPEIGPRTLGNTYEQTMVWQLFTDALTAARLVNDPADVDLIDDWQEKLDHLYGPIEIGESGQIKEWYHEVEFNKTADGSTIAEGLYDHRHMSHLLGLYPGDCITIDDKELMDAAIWSLNNKTDIATGWGMGLRIGARARTGDGDYAHKMLTGLLVVGDPEHHSPSMEMEGGGILENLWDTHIPFQIDGNFGATAGISEMLLQSNAGYINILPALPSAWSEGSYNGLVARGNFEIGAEWRNKHPVKITIKSNNGGEAVVKAKDLDGAVLTDSSGKAISYKVLEDGKVSFDTVKGEIYTFSEIPSNLIQGRQTLNFNRDWKFIRQDIDGAQAVDFDDSEWVDIALPHNFSIPYDMSSDFYVGYGWYRKAFEVPDSWDGKRFEIDFDGVFQVAEVFVNGQAVATHEGGYSAFSYDITEYIKPGENLIAVRVNNIWQRDLAPRTGDHQFTGGIYRDVYLTLTDNAHVTWYGTYVTTPDLLNPEFDENAKNVPDDFISTEQIKQNIKERRSNVRVQTEVINQSNVAKSVYVTQRVLDADNKTVTEFSSQPKTLSAGETYNFDTTSEQLQNINLWSPEAPYMYKVITTVFSDGQEVDEYESPLGFRSVQFLNDAFYLNGEKTQIFGANAHQDHGGWADAVTDSGFERDVKMIKDAGMNFIRGSHYPHDEAYVEACDKTGIMYWSECVFWGMGGQNGVDRSEATMSASDWLSDCYPQDPACEEAFEQSCMDALEAMIRVNRNHPSVICWSMGNEVFFTSSDTLQKAKDLVSKMRDRAHELDPSRKAGMGGVQREGFDSIEICDIAGYNGDGGKFTNLSMPNLVAEYGSHTGDRPDSYRPYYDQIQGSDINNYTLNQNSAGLVLWCAFHHGSVGGSGLSKMGMIDYYRLPLNSWYWYRNQAFGTAPEQSISAPATKMQLTATNTTLQNDGKSDTQIILTMLNDDGAWVNDTREVTLTVVEGPGIFPGGKTYTFVPDDTIRDGKAAIEFRSYFAGETIIKATAKGLPDATIKLTTKETISQNGKTEPKGFYDANQWSNLSGMSAEPVAYGTANIASGRPCFPSSGDETRELASDGDPSTSWVATVSGSNQYFLLDTEVTYNIYKIRLGFNKNPYPFKIQTSMNKNGPWVTVAGYLGDAVNKRAYEETLDGIGARYIRILFTDVAQNEYAFLSDLEVYGNAASLSPKYSSDGVYLSDYVSDVASVFSSGWGEHPSQKDKSIDGNPLTLGSSLETYEKGIGTHASSAADIKIDGKFSRFHSVIGIDRENGTNEGGASIFRVIGDGQLLYEKTLSGDETAVVDVSVSGVKTLRLEAKQFGDSNGNAHSDWADAKLYGAIRNISASDKLSASMVGMTPMLKGGQDYSAEFRMNNTSDKEINAKVSLNLYDKDNTLIDSAFKEIVLDKGCTESADVSIAIPFNANGCYVEALILDNDTSNNLSKPVRISADFNNIEPLGDCEWEKCDSNSVASNDKESSLSLQFTGNYIKVVAQKSQDKADAEVYIDGVFAGNIDANTADDTDSVAWTSGNIGSGSHTVTLLTDGEFCLDYFESGTATDKSKEDTNSNANAKKRNWLEQKWDSLKESFERFVQKFK